MRVTAEDIDELIARAQARIAIWGDEEAQDLNTGDQCGCNLSKMECLSWGIKVLNDPYAVLTNDDKKRIYIFMYQTGTLGEIPLNTYAGPTTTYSNGNVIINGVNTFIGLLDTPDAYVAGQLLKTTANSVIFVDDNVVLTFAQLQAKIATSKLEPGSRYTISDFKTLHLVVNDSILNTAAAIAVGTTVAIEQIVVTATSPNTLHPIALSPAFPRDILEYDVNNILCEDGTTPRNGWISKRYDGVSNNTTPFDFRQCYYLRYEVDDNAAPVYALSTGRDQFFNFTNAQTVVVVSGTVQYPTGNLLTQGLPLLYYGSTYKVTGNGVSYPSGSLLDNTTTFVNGDVLYVSSGSCTYAGGPYTAGQSFTIATASGLSFTGTGMVAKYVSVALAATFSPSSTYGNFFVGAGTCAILTTFPVGGNFVINSSFSLSFNGSGMAAVAYAEDSNIWVPADGWYKSLRPTIGYNVIISNSVFTNSQVFSIGQIAYVSSAGVSYPSGSLFDNTHTFSNGDIVYVSSGSATYAGGPYTAGQSFTITTGNGLTFSGSAMVALFTAVSLGSSFTISSTYGTGFLGAGSVTVFSGPVFNNTHTFTNGDIVKVESGSVTYNSIVWTAGQNFTIATAHGLTFTGTGIVSMFPLSVLDNSVTLTVGQDCYVVNGTVTYNAIVYTAGQNFIVVSGHTSFTGSGIVSVFSNTDWLRMINEINGVKYWLTNTSNSIGGSSIPGKVSTKTYLKALTHPSISNFTMEAADNGILNNIVVQGSGNHCRDIYLRGGCFDITIDGNNFIGHEFKSNCSNLIVDRGCQYFEYGQNTTAMTFGAFSTNVRIGKLCLNTIIGSNCRTLSLDGEVQSTKIGNNCLWIHLGYDLGSNSIGHGCGDVGMGDNVYSNKLGNSCSFNRFDFGCYSNILGSGSSSLAFIGISQRNQVKAGTTRIAFVNSNGNFLINPANTYTGSSLNGVSQKTFNTDLIGVSLHGTAITTNAGSTRYQYNNTVASNTIGNHISPDNSLWSIDFSNNGIPSYRNLLTGTVYTATSGNVTSIDAALPVSVFSASSGPITTSGTLTFTFINQSANQVFAGPTSGAAATPAFRSLVAADIPNLSSVYMPISGGTFTGAVTMNANAASALQPVTLQQMQAAFANYENLVGSWDASGNLFPVTGGTGSGGAVAKGNVWYITVAGTLGGQPVDVGDTITALTNAPGQTLANWLIVEHNFAYTPLSNVLNSGNIFVGNGSNIAAGVTLTLSGSAGSFALSNAGVLTMPDAATAARGLLNSTDWNTFNNKVSSQWTTSGSNIYYNTGSVMIGSTGTPTAKLHIVETSTSTPRGFNSDQYSTGTNGVEENFRKARGSFASPTTIVVGDVISGRNSWAHDGANFNKAAAIIVTSVGTIGTGRTPTTMQFMTMTDVTTGVLTTALTLDQNQVATFASHLVVEGVTSTGATGTGNFVFSASPTFTSQITTPAIVLNISGTAIGDIYYNSSVGNLVGKLAAGAAGKFLMFNGVGAAPIVSTLVLPNALTVNQLLYGTSTNTVGASSNLTFDGTNLVVSGKVQINTSVTTAQIVIAATNGVNAFKTISDNAGRAFVMHAQTNASTNNGYSIAFTNKEGATIVNTIGSYSVQNAGTQTGLALDLNGLYVGGVVLPTALVHVAAGTTSLAQARLTSGAINTSNTNDGDLAYDGTRINFRVSSTVKKIAWIDDSNVGSFLHNISTPTTGGTVSLTNNQYNIINPAGALLALTINLPSSPVNNDAVMIKYTQNITTVTYANGTVVDGITGPVAGQLVVLVYDSGTTSWY